MNEAKALVRERDVYCEECGYEFTTEEINDRKTIYNEVAGQVFCEPCNKKYEANKGRTIMNAVAIKEEKIEKVSHFDGETALICDSTEFKEARNEQKIEYLKVEFLLGEVTRVFELKNYEYVIFEYLDLKGRVMYQPYVSFEDTSIQYTSLDKALLGAIEYYFRGTNTYGVIACEELLEMHKPLNMKNVRYHSLHIDNQLTERTKDFTVVSTLMLNNYEYIIIQLETEDGTIRFASHYYAKSDGIDEIKDFHLTESWERAILRLLQLKYQDVSLESFLHCERILGRK
ncbi:hypothetical protein bcgnr5372_38090 [Bacillus luti]|nr:hypothetical protein [Bacillus cereus]HDR8327195.1 hypothetical protein [Bacillus cereus]HDR8337583.1 hypothetical protein [Bacillus cereus]